MILTYLIIFRNFKVILGGGQRQFGLPHNPDPDDDSCNRTDNRNLLDTWMEGRKNFKFVNNTEDLMNTDTQSVRCFAFHIILIVVIRSTVTDLMRWSFYFNEE